MPIYVHNIVVFPALSKPRIKILTSFPPHRPDKESSTLLNSIPMLISVQCNVCPEKIAHRFHRKLLKEPHGICQYVTGFADNSRNSQECFDGALWRHDMTPAAIHIASQGLPSVPFNTHVWSTQATLSSSRTPANRSCPDTRSASCALKLRSRCINSYTKPEAQHHYLPHHHT